MTRDEIIAKLRETVPALKAEGVTSLAIFGSRSRGDAKADSDLDILVDIDPTAEFSLFDLIGVQHIVQDATGLETQATLRSDIDQRMADRIADDLIKVF
jgi:predicted nucleotidyltransferase